MKVFLAEGSAAIRDRLSKMLQEIPGADVVGHAGDVREAIAGILAARPEVVMLDLKLAHGSGFDVLSEIHGHEPGIDVYMLSRYASEPHRQHARKLGAQDFFDLGSELERLREALAERAGRKN